MKLTKRNETKGISWNACIAFGVKNSAYNKARFDNDEALDLIAETVHEEDSLNLEAEQAKDFKRANDE